MFLDRECDKTLTVITDCLPGGIVIIVEFDWVVEEELSVLSPPPILIPAKSTPTSALAVVVVLVVVSPPTVSIMGFLPPSQLKLALSMGGAG